MEEAKGKKTDRGSGKMDTTTIDEYQRGYSCTHTCAH